jgi:hypothetical protein
MAKSRKTKSGSSKLSLRFNSSRRKKHQVDYRRSMLFILIVLVIISLLAAVAIGVIFLDKYVKKTTSVAETRGPIKLVNVPDWVNDRLQEKIYLAARAGGEDLKLDKDAAMSVQRNIKTRVAWLEKVTVQTEYDGLKVQTTWRKPLALVKTDTDQFYVDANMIVLDFIPISKLPIVEVKGTLPAIRRLTPGSVWQREDVAAAVDILRRLDKMDSLVTPKKPLLYEIESIDISNYNGLKNAKAPHIVLYAKDGTVIIWGAELKTWQRYLEATDEEKLAKLYSLYNERGTLLGNVKYINLSDPQGRISLPVDKYNTSR